MTTIKNRLTKVEQAAHNQGKGQRRIFVLYEGKDFGHYMSGQNHEEVPLADFMSTRQDNDVLIKVRYKKREPAYR